MANLQSQIDILAKAVVKEHIGFEEFKVNNKGSVSLTEISRDAKVYNSVGDKITDANGGGVLENYKEDSYKLDVNVDGNLSTATIFTYDEDHNFSGFWFYDNDEHNYAINDRGKIITSNSVDPYLKRGTFVRRIGLNEGEIGNTQNDKNDERMVYINKDVLVNKMLIYYNENTLIIEDSGDGKTWIGNYYVEFSDLEGNDIQLIINSDLNSIIYSNNSGYSVVKDDTVTETTGINFDILYTDSNNNSKIVYAYRSRNIINGEFTNEIILLAVHLTSDVTEIGGSAFRGCTSLIQVTIPNNVETIGGSAFRGCTSLTQVTIPNSVETISNSVFYGCTSLTQITIPSSVTSIDGGAFHSCTSLKEVTIPSNVETIGGSAFRGCTSLTQVTIPNSVKTIGTNAFYGCTSLTQITIEDTLESVESNAFNTGSILTIYCNDENTKKLISADASGNGYSVIFG